MCFGTRFAQCAPIVDLRRSRGRRKWLPEETQRAPVPFPDRDSKSPLCSPLEHFFQGDNALKGLWPGSPGTRASEWLLLGNHRRFTLTTNLSVRIIWDNCLGEKKCRFLSLCQTIASDPPTDKSGTLCFSQCYFFFFGGVRNTGLQDLCPLAAHSR